RLIPEVVVEGRERAAVLPAALDLERACVKDREAAGASAVAIAEHTDDDVVARHAVNGVRPRVARPVDQLLRLDALLASRPPRAWRSAPLAVTRRTRRGCCAGRARSP